MSTDYGIFTKAIKNHSRGQFTASVSIKKVKFMYISNWRGRLPALISLRRVAGTIGSCPDYEKIYNINKTNLS